MHKALGLFAAYTYIVLPRVNIFEVIDLPKVFSCFFNISGLL